MVGVLNSTICTGFGNPKPKATTGNMAKILFLKADRIIMAIFRKTKYSYPKPSTVRIGYFDGPTIEENEAAISNSADNVVRSATKILYTIRIVQINDYSS